MENLPLEINQIIFNYIPTSSKKNLNKTLFKKYYHINMNSIITGKRFHSYVRFIIRNKCSIHLEKILDIHYIKFLRMKRWKYRHSSYPNYLIYIKSESLKYNSSKCYELVNKYLDPSKKNKYKRIRTKNIRWTN